MASSDEIKIGSVVLDYIMDFSINESTDFAIKSTMGKKTPTIERGMFVVSPKIYQIMARVTNSKRDDLQTKKDNHETLIFIYDEDTYRVKFEEFESIWAGDENFARPWIVTITLVAEIKLGPNAFNYDRLTGQIYVSDPSVAITPQWGGAYDNR